MSFTNCRPLFTIILLLALIPGCATSPTSESELPEWTGDSVKSANPTGATQPVDSTTKQKTEGNATKTDKTSLFSFLSNLYGNDDEAEQIENADNQESISDTENTLPEAAKPIGITANDQQPLEPQSPETGHSNDMTAIEPTTTAITEKAVIPQLFAHNSEHERQASEAKEQFTLALDTAKNGDQEKALALLRSIASKYPLLSGPNLNEAIILHQQGKLKEARKVLQDALFKKTKNPYLLNQLGIVNRELGHFEQAKLSYLSAVRISPQYAKAHFNLAILADLYLHDPQLALEEFTIYQSLQEVPDKKVSGWIKELKRRVKRIKKKPA